MASTLRLVPLLLVASAVVALGAFSSDAGSEPTPLSRVTHEVPEVSVVTLPHAAPEGPTLVGRARPAATEPQDEPDRGPAVVCVVGPRGRMQDVGIYVFGHGKWGHVRLETDEVGRIELSDVPYDGSVTVLLDALPLVPRAEGTSRASAVIRGPRTMIETKETMALEVSFRDAERGALVHGVPFRLSRSAEDTLSSATTRAVIARPGRRRTLRLRARPRAGLVAFDGLMATFVISRRATSLWMEGTFRREALVFLHAVDVDGHCVVDAEVEGIEVAGVEVFGAHRGARDGELIRVHGVPFLRRERVRILAARPQPAVAEEEWVEEEIDTVEQFYESDGIMPLLPDDAWETCAVYDPGMAAIARGRLPARIEEALVLRAVFDPDAPVRSVGVGFSLGCGSGDYGRHHGERGSVRVTVVDAERRPLAGVEVWLRGRERRSNLEGVAVFQDIPEGRRTVVLREPGWVRTRHDVMVRGGETVETTLVEDQGGEVLVRVLDDEGLPLAGARIEVHDWAAWADVEDGVQRLDIATDHRGERLLRRFPGGKTKLGARWGRRVGKGEVRVVSGRRKTLEIRLAPDAD